MSDSKLPAPASPDPAIPGYKLIEKYSETSRAEVWTALQVSLERTVTLWVLKRESAAIPGVADYFERVARAVSRIRHPNFVQVIDIARLSDGTPYMVLENIEGASLTATLHVDRRIDSRRAAGIVLEIAKALDFAWKQCGFIHRNIKPDTILLSAGDVVKITNYNTAVLVRPGENPLAHDDGMVIGTPNYASPEQIECLRTIDFHTDMYSTGALFYQMATGRVPFGDEPDPMKVLDLQRAGTLEDPRKIVPNVPPGFVHIMQRMMAKSPDDRYPWWQDVIEDLQRVLDGRPPYLPGAYTPPLSTIAVSGAGAAASAVAPGASKPVRRIRNVAGAAAPSGPEKPPPAARRPGFLGLLPGLVLVVAIGVLVGRHRILSLERPGHVASGGPATPSAESVDLADADDETTGAADPAADAGESSDAATDDADGSESAASDSAPAVGDAGGLNGDSAVAPTSAGSSVDAAEGYTQARLVADIYNAIKTQPFTNAVAYAKKAFQEHEDNPRIDLDESRRIWGALRSACSFEDMLGHSVASSHGSRKISVDGEEIEFTTKAYADGELIGFATSSDDDAPKPVRIKVARMTPQEMYDLVLSTVVSTNRADLLSRAFLIMKVGDAGGFSLFVEKHKLDALAPFVDHVGK
ncbi:MAG: serine/threonine protein kinase [Kiritimatiellia bacterium]|jgi:hypothetical protein